LNCIQPIKKNDEDNIGKTGKKLKDFYIEIKKKKELELKIHE
jgi:hypothetical protein